MVRNAHYSRFTFEKSILRPETDTLSGVPGFVIIAVLETGDHMINLTYVSCLDLLLENHPRACRAVKGSRSEGESPGP
jgi:hypothetical protein